MDSAVGSLIDDHRLNALLSWILVGFLLVAATTSLVRGDFLWAAFALSVACLAILPPVALRNRYAMIPWEVTVLTALPILGGAFASIELTSDLATYLSVAAIALVVAVELQLFTTVRMNDGFALLFVVVALAVAYRDLLDILLGLVGIAAVLVWDVGEFGTTLGHEIGGGSGARRTELVHATGMLAVGGVGGVEAGHIERTCPFL